MFSVPYNNNKKLERLGFSVLMFNLFMRTLQKQTNKTKKTTHKTKQNKTQKKNPQKTKTKTRKPNNSE